MKTDGLDPKLVWQADGHLSDESLVILADAQEGLLPQDAEVHATSCDSCTTRLGELALLSARTHEAFAALAPAVQEARTRFPALAVVAALVIAALGLVPTLTTSLAQLLALPANALQGMLILIKSGAVLLRHGFEGPIWIAAWAGAAVLLTVAGLLIARANPRSLAWKGISQ
ncbi:MAG: hypothetical protein R3B13_15820 [Polyangiaceae bacterium]